jgi:hypothetical protein
MRKLEDWVNWVRGAGQLWGLAIPILLLVAAAVQAQGQGQNVASTATVLISSGTAALAVRPEQAGDELIREIDDPHSGARWLLYRDQAHPAGPGRLVQARTGQIPASHLDHGRAGLRPQPSIHAGDRVVLEEDSPVVSARLQAVALNMADKGSRVRVRLQIGGRVVEAIAEAPGRVSLAPSDSLAPLLARAGERPGR